MSAKIICTVGTSTLEKIKDKDLPWEKYGHVGNDVWYRNHEVLQGICHNYTEERRELKGSNIDTKTFQDDILYHVDEASNLMIKKASEKPWKEWEVNTWRIMPAEVGSTLRITEKFDLTPKSIEVLLTLSDTGESYACGLIISKILQSIGFKVSYEVIEGFQMLDIDWFSKKGLPVFIETVVNNLDDELQVFNITGGYKNFIPLVTHIASFHGKDMYYVFEESISENRGLLKIPRIPTLNRLFKTNDDAADTLLYILNEVDSASYDSVDMIEESIRRFVDDHFSDVSEDIAAEYEDFLHDFFENEEGTFVLSLMGEVYLNLIEFKQEKVDK